MLKKIIVSPSPYQV